MHERYGPFGIQRMREVLVREWATVDGLATRSVALCEVCTRQGQRVRPHRMTINGDTIPPPWIMKLVIER